MSIKRGLLKVALSIRVLLALRALGVWGALLTLRTLLVLLTFSSTPILFASGIGLSGRLLLTLLESLLGGLLLLTLWVRLLCICVIIKVRLLLTVLCLLCLLF